MQQPSFFAQGGSSFSSMNFDVPAGLGFSSQVSLASQAGGLQGADLNSPEVFKQNIQIALACMARVQGLASSVLAGIEHAYRDRTSPMQTAADIAALTQELLALVEHLRQTGVGALPLEAPAASGSGSVPDAARSDEQLQLQLVGEATRAVQVLYERQKRIQDGAGVVAGLLGQGLGVGLGAGLSTGMGSAGSGGLSAQLQGPGSGERERELSGQGQGQGPQAASAARPGRAGQA